MNWNADNSLAKILIEEEAGVHPNNIRCKVGREELGSGRG